MNVKQESAVPKMLRKAPRLTRRQALSAWPVRNQAFEARRTREGETEITIPRRNDWLGKLLAFLFFVPRERKVVLEPIGSEVWDLCDGKHSVSEIAEALMKKHKLDRREAETSLSEYLRRLGRRRLVVFAIPRSSLEAKPTGDRR
jgi:hypothetical protein